MEDDMTVLDRAANVEKIKQLAKIGEQALKQQEQAKIAQAVDEAHTLGIDDGLASAQRYLSKQQAYKLGYYRPESEYSTEEVMQAKQRLGRMPDVRDLQEIRRLKQLQQMGIPADENGLAVKAIKGE